MTLMPRRDTVSTVTTRSISFNVGQLLAGQAVERRPRQFGSAASALRISRPASLRAVQGSSLADRSVGRRCSIAGGTVWLVVADAVVAISAPPSETGWPRLLGLLLCELYPSILSPARCAGVRALLALAGGQRAGRDRHHRHHPAVTSRHREAGDAIHRR